jgi:NAD(P)H-hydrate repair Nnr-like enzyme with NAD(P)H-hydrate dehydratase domain
MLATTKQLLPLLKSVFPPLLATSKKGDNGRIAVIGGSF